MTMLHLYTIKIKLKSQGIIFKFIKKMLYFIAFWHKTMIFFYMAIFKKGSVNHHPILAGVAGGV